MIFGISPCLLLIFLPLRKRSENEMPRDWVEIVMTGSENEGNDELQVVVVLIIMTGPTSSYSPRRYYVAEGWRLLLSSVLT